MNDSKQSNFTSIYRKFIMKKHLLSITLFSSLFVIACTEKKEENDYKADAEKMCKCFQEGKTDSQKYMECSEENIKMRDKYKDDNESLTKYDELLMECTK